MAMAASCSTLPMRMCVDNGALSSRCLAASMRPRLLPQMQITTKLSRSRFPARATSAVEEPVEESSIDAEPSIATPVAEEAAAPATLALPQQKIRVKLRAYFGEYIEEAAKMIVEAVKNTGAGVMGPVPLPTERKIFCVLRSPHVDKDSREHFQIKTHKRLIDIKNPNPRTIDALMQLDIPAGVDVEVKL
ncbi:uncharacterized protein LOC9651203 [Selaginella moellendorffii]|uniref:uncharacterized protein LOC9651203 n=1 Tax=Selaginella moellendorffii TaxID=88036 RepID=UPI000D1C2896|nr:uncharacterized protein LOC9651203 [Selaginella moellendorffii]|eukprot:XP_002983739.2 uncharacterized protein LOC9651203 [Selaginella moellendorffii]